MRVFLYPYAGPGGRNYLKDLGTLQDVQLNDICLAEGLRLDFYCDDADENGDPDELMFEGIVHLDPEQQKWYAIIDEGTYRHASDLHGSTGHYKRQRRS